MGVPTLVITLDESTPERARLRQWLHDSWIEAIQAGCYIDSLEQYALDLISCARLREIMNGSETPLTNNEEEALKTQTESLRELRNMERRVRAKSLLSGDMQDVGPRGDPAPMRGTFADNAKE